MTSISLWSANTVLTKLTLSSKEKKDCLLVLPATATITLSKILVARWAMFSWPNVIGSNVPG